MGPCFGGCTRYLDSLDCHMLNAVRSADCVLVIPVGHNLNMLHIYINYTAPRTSRPMNPHNFVSKPNATNDVTIVYLIPKPLGLHVRHYKTRSWPNYRLREHRVVDGRTRLIMYTKRISTP